MIALLALFLAGCADPVLPDAAWYDCGALNTDHPRAAQYQEIIDDLLATGAPSVSAAVISPEGSWAGAGGQVDLIQGIDARSCHRYPFASVTKMFAASTVMTLVEDGALSLDAPAREHLPAEVVERVANADTATIRQLLQHTSGVPEYVTMGYYLDAFDQALPMSTVIDELSYIYGLKADFEPGAGLSYSNSNYLLLSLIIEDITGETAYDVVRSRVLDPLGLESTMGRSEQPDAVSRGYADLRGNGEWVDQTEVSASVMASPGKLDGGLISTPLEVATLLEALGDGALVSAESLEEMQAFQTYDEIDGLEDAYGLGLARIQTQHGEAWGHYGGLYPFSSLAYHFPDHDTTVVVVVSGWSDALSEWGTSEAAYDIVLSSGR